jgi:hypothetical protein
MKTIKIFYTFLLLFVVHKASSQSTEKALRTLSFVDQVKPDLNRNIFIVTFKKGSSVNFDQLNKKVQDAGFSIGKLDATINFNQTAIDADGQAVIGNTVYRFTNARSKVLNGPVKVSLLDKNFVSIRTFKQKMAIVKFDSYPTGMGVVNGKKTRIYHLSI